MSSIHYNGQCQSNSYRLKGVIFGWMSIELIFNRQGLFNYMCDSTAPASAPETSMLVSSLISIGKSVSSSTESTVGGGNSCAKRNNYLTSIYTLGVSMNIVSYLLWGIILDWIGPRITSLASLTIAIIGNLLFAISSDLTRNFFHAGFVCIGIGGIGLHLASFHLANSAPPKIGGLAVSIFPLMFNISAVVYPFLNVLSMAGMTFNGIFIGYTILLCVAWPALFWIQEWRPLTREPVPPPPPVPEANLIVLERVDHEEGHAAAAEALHTTDKYAWLKFMPNMHNSPWTQQMLSGYFVITLIFIASVMTRNAFWQGTIARQLRSYGATTDVYAIIISWFPALIIILLPILGPSVDKYGLPFVLGLGCIFQVIYAALALVKNVPSQLVTGIVAILSRAVVMTSYFTCVAMVCGYKTFGRISGTAMAAGGVVNFSSIPLNYLINNTFNGDFFWVQIFELLWGIPLCAYPYYLWKSGKNQAYQDTIRKLEATLESEEPQTGSSTPTLNGRSSNDSTLNI